MKRNMDKCEQEKVDIILERLSKVIGGVDEIVFSSKETEKIIDMDENFYKKIKKVKGISGESYFEWNGYKLPNPMFDVSVYYYQCGIGALEDIGKLKDKDIIDAGAYIGDSSVVLANYTKKDVYAFEAFYDNFKQIDNICKINETKNVIPVNLAISAQSDDIVTFYIREAGQTGHGIIKRNGLGYKSEVNVKTITIDEYVKQHNLQVGLIKAHIEGAERELIKGAKETILKYKPALLISIYHTADDFFELKKLIEDFNIGYKFKIFLPITAKNIFLETMLVCEVCDTN
ncbi:MAG: FkbM family methyltransferase [Hungatella sp.]|nr:FkbM family methyltransferase [Hungatella sp.]